MPGRRSAVSRSAPPIDRSARAVGGDRAAGDPPPEGTTLRLDLRGSAGQSFGAFVTDGVELHLVGQANDYLGKGLSGGVVVVRPEPEVVADPSKSSARRERLPVRCDRRPTPRRRPGGDAVRRPEQRCGCGRRGPRRARLRVHDRGCRGRPRTRRGELRCRDDRRPGVPVRPERPMGAGARRDERGRHPAVGVVRDRADGDERLTELRRLIDAHAAAGSELAERLSLRGEPCEPVACRPVWRRRARRSMPPGWPCRSSVPTRGPVATRSARPPRSLHSPEVMRSGARPRPPEEPPMTARPNPAVRGEPRGIGTAGARDPLAREVRLLGALLGQVIVEQEGLELLELVERVRRRTIALRRADDPVERAKLAARARRPGPDAGGGAHPVVRAVLPAGQPGRGAAPRPDPAQARTGRPGRASSMTRSPRPSGGCGGPVVAWTTSSSASAGCRSPRS